LVLDFKNTRQNVNQDQMGIHKKSAHCQLSRDNKSALTDHTNQENHTINWSKVTVIDREPDCLIRLIKEAIYIRKEGVQSMNAMKAAMNSVTHTTAFLAHQVQVLVVPITGRTSTSFFY